MVAVQNELDRLRIPLGEQRASVLGPLASPALLETFEERFGFVVPDDYRWFLQHGAGQRLKVAVSVRLPQHARSAPGAIVAGSLGELFDFASLEHHASLDRWITTGPVGDTLQEIDPTAERRFYEYLLPISTGHHNEFYALDYRFAAVDPPVVVLRPDESELIYRTVSDQPADVTEFFRYVAPSFTQLLKQMSSEAEDASLDELPYLDETPYPWADQVLAWEAFTDAYLAEHTGPIAPRRD